MKMKDARAVVTGAASGLGNAVARHVAAQGGKVTLLDVQEGPGQAAAAELGAGARFVKCDVTSEAEVNAAMESARAFMGGINLLVNCAGVIGAGRVLGRNGPMAGDFFTRVIHINLIGTFLCDKAAANIMQANTPSEDGERGVLIHTSSVAAFASLTSARVSAQPRISTPFARSIAAKTKRTVRTIMEPPGVHSGLGRTDRTDRRTRTYGSCPSCPSCPRGQVRKCPRLSRLSKMSELSKLKEPKC